MSARLDALCPELLHLQMPPSTIPTQRLSNNALNLLLSDMLYFWYCDGCRIFDLMRGLERQWFRGEFRFQVSSLQCFRPGWWNSYLSPTTNHWHSHWQKPATSILRNPRESYDSGSSRCKIKHTWALLIPFALKMWLTWYQVVDHVCYSQSSMAKGKCSIDDSLSSKVSPFLNFQYTLPFVIFT